MQNVYKRETYSGFYTSVEKEKKWVVEFKNKSEGQVVTSEPFDTFSESVDFAQNLAAQDERYRQKLEAKMRSGITKKKYKKRNPPKAEGKNTEPKKDEKKGSVVGKNKNNKKT